MNEDNSTRTVEACPHKSAFPVLEQRVTALEQAMAQQAATDEELRNMIVHDKEERMTGMHEISMKLDLLSRDVAYIKDNRISESEHTVLKLKVEELTRKLERMETDQRDSDRQPKKRAEQLLYKIIEVLVIGIVAFAAAKFGLSL